jgi:predicted transcriptional regulator
MSGSAPPRSILLSLKPRFASAILLGTKTAEVRRQRAVADPGTQVVIYASAPMMAVVGTAVVVVVDYSSKSELWERHKGDLALTEHEFETYLDGSSNGCVLLLEQVKELASPILLAELRAEVKTFQPPQSYRFVTRSDPQSIQSILRSQDSASEQLEL